MVGNSLGDVTQGKGVAFGRRRLVESQRVSAECRAPTDGLMSRPSRELKNGFCYHINKKRVPGTGSLEGGFYRSDVGRLKPLRFSEGIQPTQGALAPSEMK